MIPQSQYTTIELLVLNINLFKCHLATWSFSRRVETQYNFIGFLWVKPTPGCSPRQSALNSAVSEIWRFSALFQRTSRTSALIGSDFLWISAVHNWKIQRCFRENQLWISAVQCWFLQLWNRGFSSLNNADSELIYFESALIFTLVEKSIKVWKGSQNW